MLSEIELYLESPSLFVLQFVHSMHTVHLYSKTQTYLHIFMCVHNLIFPWSTQSSPLISTTVLSKHMVSFACHHIIYYIYIILLHYIYMDNTVLISFLVMKSKLKSTQFRLHISFQFITYIYLHIAVNAHHSIHPTVSTLECSMQYD